MMTNEGRLFVLIGPSGTGKNTIINALLHDSGMDFLSQLPTVTTRPMRPNETEGVQHYFVTEAAFQDLIIKDALIEYQRVHNTDYYGTPRAEVEKLIRQGGARIADLDIYGARAVKAAFPEHTVLIFISPPDHDTLEARIRARKTEDEHVIQRRLARADMEMGYAFKTDYVVVNDDLDNSIRLVCGIIQQCTQQFNHQAPVFARAWLTNPAGEVLAINGDLPRIPVQQQDVGAAVMRYLHQRYALKVSLPLEHPYQACWCRAVDGQIINEIVVPLHITEMPPANNGEWHCPSELDIPFHIKKSLAAPEAIY